MKKKVLWIVWKDGEEVARCRSRKMAEVVANDICGTFHKYEAV